MYLTSTGRAFTGCVTYDKSATGRWVARFDGALTLTAEARTPQEALQQLQEQLDVLLAKWLVSRPDEEKASSSDAGRRRKNSAQTSLETLR